MLQFRRGRIFLEARQFEYYYWCDLRTFIGVETAALTFRTKQYSTSYSSHICYGKRFYNDFFLNHHTIALVNSFLKLLNSVVIETVLDSVKKRINYLNSLLSTRKRTILTSSRTVLNALNAMIARHVCFWVFEKRLTQENCFLFCKKYEKDQ